ncbi:MAG: hypothetical protein JXP73_02585 [Deltaproteobacteria bacterium]|nr:hypothetical protein [Deltaproteobacteria bacterium]
MAESSSRLRLRLRQALERHQKQVDQLVEESGPLIRGTFGTRGRVCGTAGCHCTRGELHESKFLSAREDGQTRQVHVPAGDEIEVREGVARYRRFRQVRVALAESAKEELDLAEQLGLSLLKPYPPDHPLPPPKRRGRSKGGRGVSR